MTWSTLTKEMRPAKSVELNHQVKRLRNQEARVLEEALMCQIKIIMNYDGAVLRAWE